MTPPTPEPRVSRSGNQGEAGISPSPLSPLCPSFGEALRAVLGVWREPGGPRAQHPSHVPGHGPRAPQGLVSPVSGAPVALEVSPVWNASSSKPLNKAQPTAPPQVALLPTQPLRLSIFPLSSSDLTLIPPWNCGH